MFRRVPQMDCFDSVKSNMRKYRTAIALFGLAAAWAQSPSPQKTSPEQTAAVLQRMTAAGKTEQQLARYVFDTHGCRSCHTAGHDGKLGYTARGKKLAQGFEGCVNLLTAMTVIAQVPGEQRSPQQAQRAANFEAWGCTECHKVAPGKLVLTEIGEKLSHLHLGCVDVEKLTAARR
jgi:hypothetical protein